MTSQINPNYPVQGNPTTATVRANFATAAQEISALQTNTTGAPFLPIAGGQMHGAITLYNDPTALMHPVTLGYFQANGGGGGSGPGGVPEAPADGTLYGRQDGSWLHAVGTTELNNAINAAPFLKLTGGTLTGALVLSGPPTVALNPASKGYVDGGFLALGGGTLTGPLTLAGDATTALGAATKQQIDNQHFIPQLGPGAIGVTVADNTTGQDRTPVIAGLTTPYNANSDGIKIQAKRLAAPGGPSNANGDGAHIQLIGPGNATSPNCITLNAGNNTAGYAQWLFGPDGGLNSPGTGIVAFKSGRVMSVNTSANPSISVWDTASGAAGMWFNGTATALTFGSVTGTGAPQTAWASFNSAGIFQAGNGGLTADPLSIIVATGRTARMWATVANVRSWSVGTMTTGDFEIADQTGGRGMMYFRQNASIDVYTSSPQKFNFQTGWGVSFPCTVSYPDTHGFCFMWTQPNAGVVNVSVDGSAAVVGLQPVSDGRTKADLAPSTHDCLATVEQFSLRQFRRKDLSNLHVHSDSMTPRHDAPLHRVGLVAQEVHQAFPEGATAGDTTTGRLGHLWDLDHGTLLALGFGAMQQLAARVAALEAKGL